MTDQEKHDALCAIIKRMFAEMQQVDPDLEHVWICTDETAPGFGPKPITNIGFERKSLTHFKAA